MSFELTEMADDQIMQMQLVAAGWAPNGRDLLRSLEYSIRNIPVIKHATVYSGKSPHL